MSARPRSGLRRPKKSCVSGSRGERGRWVASVSAPGHSDKGVNEEGRKTDRGPCKVEGELRPVKLERAHGEAAGGGPDDGRVERLDEDVRGEAHADVERRPHDGEGPARGLTGRLCQTRVPALEGRLGDLAVGHTEHEREADLRGESSVSSEAGSVKSQGEARTAIAGLRGSWRRMGGSVNGILSCAGTQLVSRACGRRVCIVSATLNSIGETCGLPALLCRRLLPPVPPTSRPGQVSPSWSARNKPQASTNLLRLCGRLCGPYHAPPASG